MGQRLAWGAKPVPMLVRSHVTVHERPPTVELYDQDADDCDPAGIRRPMLDAPICRDCGNSVGDRDIDRLGYDTGRRRWFHLHCQGTRR